PIGNVPPEGEEICAFSREKKCKSHARLVLRLAERTKQGGYERMRGTENRTLRFETGSDYSMSYILGELDRVADQLRMVRDGRETGWLAGLPATLTMRFERKNYRHGNNGEKKGVSYVAQYHLVFDEAEVKRRELHIREYE